MMSRVIRLFFYFLAAALFVLPVLLDNKFYYDVAISVIINGMLGLSLYILLRIDQLSLMQGALMGAGAYTSALLALHTNIPFIAVFLLAGLVPALVALLAGPILLRLRGITFVLVTFAFNQIIVLIFTEWVSIFGGNNGLPDIPVASIFNVTLPNGFSLYLFTVIILLLALFVLRRLLNGRLGMVVHALHSNEALLRSLGVNALAYRMVIFVISGFIAGLAGSLYAHHIGLLVPGSFSFWTSVNAIIFNVIGGSSYIFGSIIGAAVIVPLPQVLQALVKYQQFIYGGILLLAMFFLPKGVLSLIPFKTKRIN